MKVKLLGVVGLCVASSVVFASPLLVTTKQEVAQNGATFKESSELAANVIKVVNARVEPESKVQGATEIYMQLDNTGQKAHTLIAAYSPVATQTVLHDTVKAGDHTMMHRVKAIEIKAHQDKDLQTGGLHVMLIGVKQPIENSDLKNVPVRLIYSDGSSQEVTARIG